MASNIKRKRRIGSYTINKDTINKEERNDFYSQTDASVWIRSCEKEVDVPLNGNVSGNIPKWLNGTLIRNGPGSLRVAQCEFKHLFDGSALLHKFTIKNGNVTYQCKFVKSDVYKKNWQAKRIVVTDFGTSSTPDPCHNIFQRFKSFFKSDVSDNPNITVYPFNDELYALSETPALFKINLDNLETEKVHLDRHVSIVHHTSHPHVTNDGTVYSLGMSVTLNGPQHNIIRFPAKKVMNDAGGDKMGKNSVFHECKIVAKLPSRWKFHPSYMHSFGLTKRYFVIVEQPLNISVPLILLAKLKNDPTASTLKWFDKCHTQINVIDRQSGKLVFKFLTESFFYLHLINQYEIDDYIVLDICCYKDPSMLKCMYVESMKQIHNNPNYAKMFRSKPLRFVLPLFKRRNTKKNLIELIGTNAEAYQIGDDMHVVPELLSDVGCETPTINYEKCSGEFYRYFYAMSSDVDGKYPGMLIKVDTIKKSFKTWHEYNCYASEPIFVQSPNPQSEDDGVLLSSLVWGGKDENHVTLLILNAITMMEIGRCDFRTDSPVPKCLHGWFLSE